MNKSLLIISFFATLIMAGCNSGPTPIRLGQDACDFCKMTIADKNFGGEIITTKGKVYKFDDTHCLAAFRAEKIDSGIIKDVYLVNFNEPHNFIKIQDAILIKSDEGIHSPMGGNTAAFDDEAAANATLNRVNGTRISFQELYNTEK